MSNFLILTSFVTSLVLSNDKFLSTAFTVWNQFNSNHH